LALALARRFRDHEDTILASWPISPCPSPTTRPNAMSALSKSSNESPAAPWRTLTGLADFTIVEFYLSTATKWGLGTLDVLTQLFTVQHWLPPAPEPY
jgi:transposase